MEFLVDEIFSLVITRQIAEIFILSCAVNALNNAVFSGKISDRNDNFLQSELACLRIRSLQITKNKFVFSNKT